MFKNYLKVALRNFSRNKVFSFINVSGLAIGIACCLLILLYIQDELSYDNFNKKADRIYRVNSLLKFGGKEMDMPSSSDMMGAALKNDYPQVEQFTRIYTFNGSKMVKKGNEYITEEHVAYADSTFFDVFTFPALYGNTVIALNQPNSVVLSKSAAMKYIGTVNVIGKTLEIIDNDRILFDKITAVIKDMPGNSHFRFDFIFSMKDLKYEWGNYLSHNFFTYLVLKKGTNYKEFEKNFVQYIDKYALPQAQQFMSIKSMKDFESAGNKLQYSLIPLKDIHLYSTRQYELSAGGNYQYIYIFSGVALFILMIACINFMNLTTARSAGRTREVGIRKVLGTEYRNLVVQFLTESVLMSFFSVILAVIIVNITLPSFNNLADKHLVFNKLFSLPGILTLLVLTFITGITAGSYPAFFLSRFNPIQVIKGKFQGGAKSKNLRSILVVFQFSASIIFITGTIIIYRQLNYIQNKSLGYQKDQILSIENAGALGNSIDAFKNEMLKTHGVISGTISGFLPTPSYRSDNSFFKEAEMDPKNGFNMQNWVVDYDYIKTFEMEIIKGRNFSKEFGTDSTAIILNETAVKLLGYKDPLGQKVYTLTSIKANSLKTYNIIGIVKNFHFESLRKDIGPLSLILGKSPGSISFKVNAAYIPAILKQAGDTWKSMASGMPFSYKFMDDSFSEVYRAEQKIGTIAFGFSILAIFVACLGLFGLAAFIAEQRTKEIGIRKVLGASTNGIIILLSKDFLKLIFISLLIASPFAWFIMSSWLQDFAYHVNISWWIFAASGLLTIIISLVTVGYQAVKAAFANPVKSLKYE